MRTTLIISGGLACLALLFPSLVTLGFYLFVVPGLVLALAPTVFIYLTATAALRSVLPMPAGWTRDLVAFGIALMIGWAVMQPFYAWGRSAHLAKVQPDVEAEAPIELAGHVRIERARRPREDSRVCDYLSAALLDLPAVVGVSSITGGEASAFALVSATAHPEPGLFPDDPARLLWKLRNHHPRIALDGIPENHQEAKRRLEAHWALRLARDERLVRRSVVPIGRADWVLRLTSDRSSRNAIVQRVEVLDATGGTRFRKSEVCHRVPARMFYVGFGRQAVEVGRETLRAGKLAPSGLESTLLAAIKLRKQVLGDDLLAELRDEVVRALDDPNATRPQVGLVNRWLALLHDDIEEGDLALIEQLVADRRVHDVAGALERVFHQGRVPVQLRDCYAQRILMDQTSGQNRTRLAKALASMPAGTFATPHATHRAIWEDVKLRVDAAPFLSRVADLEADEATSMLIAVMDDATQLTPWRDRRAVVEGVRAGFLRLGPKAASASERLKTLFLMRPSPITNSARDAEEWRFTLARMGVAVEELFYPSQGKELRKRETAKLRDRLQRSQTQHKQGDGAT